MIFVFVSDDMAWGRKNLAAKNNDVYFEGCGDGDDEDCIGNDLERTNCHPADDVPSGKQRKKENNFMLRKGEGREKWGKPWAK